MLRNSPASWAQAAVALGVCFALFGPTLAASAAPRLTTPLRAPAPGHARIKVPSRDTSQESVLHGFLGGNDGSVPYAGLTADTTGALYGTTFYGGNACADGGCGTVFKLTPAGSGYTESVLYSFQGGTDGANPKAGLIARAGALYGTTYSGFATGCGPGGTFGCGTVFKLTP
jgi:uncharacterized repeat protein (TIGR03803 family)